MYKPLQLEISVATHTHTGKVVAMYDVCEAGAGDMVAEICEPDGNGRKTAMLFAAAPDLYHALLGMVNFYGQMPASARKHLVKAERKVLAAAEKALKRVEEL